MNRAKELLTVVHMLRELAFNMKLHIYLLMLFFTARVCYYSVVFRAFSVHCI